MFSKAKLSFAERKFECRKYFERAEVILAIVATGKVNFSTSEADCYECDKNLIN